MKLRYFAFLIFFSAIGISCDSNRTDFILFVENNSSTQVTVRYTIGGDKGFKIYPAGEDLVLYTDFCEGCDISSYECLQDVDTMYITTSDGRQLRFDIKDPLLWEQRTDLNPEGSIIRCSISIDETDLD